MRRAVLDTNVVVSGWIRPQGPPGRLLALLAEATAFELVLSPSLLAEIQRAVRYPRVRSRIRLSETDLNLRLAMLDVLSIPVGPRTEALGVAEDPDDDRVLAAAVEGRAGHVVTGDSGLLRLEAYEGIRIVTPRAFLDLLSG